VIDPAVETLPFEYAQLDLGHVQPTALLGCVVELEAIKVRLSNVWWEELIEAGRIVCVELIDHHPDALGIRVVVIREFDHPVDPFGGASSLGNLDGDPASQRFCGKVNPLFPIECVAVIDAFDRPGSAGSGSLSWP